MHTERLFYELELDKLMDAWMDYIDERGVSSFSQSVSISYTVFRSDSKTVSNSLTTGQHIL